MLQCYILSSVDIKEALIDQCGMKDLTTRESSLQKKDTQKQMADVNQKNGVEAVVSTANR
jgi:hypothetical protein